MQRIIYKNRDNSIGVLIPSPECLARLIVSAVVDSTIALTPEDYTIAMHKIAVKDVPAPYEYPVTLGDNLIGFETYNTPYWIVSTDVIPTDRTDRDAWELDGGEGEPDGYGGESHEFEVTP